MQGGWMHTGDIGTVDKAGYFTFLDRSKEMIKSGGFNVSPSEIEAVLMRLDGVVECAVFGVPDETFAEVPFACVTVREGGPRTPTRSGRIAPGCWRNSRCPPASRPGYRRCHAWRTRR
ncbi:AMP-binding enzyme [Sphingomonas sp. MMS24-JH45]